MNNDRADACTYITVISDVPSQAGQDAKTLVLWLDVVSIYGGQDNEVADQNGVIVFHLRDRQPKKIGTTVPTIMIFHEVNDVGHWLGSPRRAEVFGPMGITARTFVDPEKTNRVGLIVEVPDMDAFGQVMESEVAADAMRFDGVRPETLVILVES